MNILVVSTPTGSALPAVSAELIGGARRLLAHTGGTVEAAVMGSGAAGACREAVAFGADRVYAVESELLQEHDAETFVQALEALVREVAPAVVLLAGDAFGSDLAPRLAHLLGTGAVTSCSGIRISEDGEVVFTRPVYGGKAVAEMVVPGSPAIAAVAPRCLEPLARDDTRRAEIVAIEPKVAGGARRVKVLEVREEEAGGIRLEDARIIVSGGRGLGDPSGFRLLEELAKVLGGAVGSSRPPVDLGWVPLAMQIGQTGKSVAPDLYVAIGISGASQHLAGMGRARHIVVINKDPEAPFFGAAELGAAADYRKLLPLLTERLRALLDH